MTRVYRLHPVQTRDVKPSVEDRTTNEEKKQETDDRANGLTVTGGLESECCGEERTTGGIPLAGLVPGPLPPAN